MKTLTIAIILTLTSLVTFGQTKNTIILIQPRGATVCNAIQIKAWKGYYNIQKVVNTKTTITYYLISK